MGLFILILLVTLIPEAQTIRRRGMRGTNLADMFQLLILGLALMAAAVLLRRLVVVVV